MSAQVRIDDDVAEALDKAVARAGGGISRSHAANVRLRQALGLPLVPGAALTERPAATGGVGISSPARVVVRQVTGPTATARAARSGCTHPVNRRIGDHCGACGSPIKSR